MKILKIFSPSLTCGCILGKHLCEEAEALWWEVNHAYDAYLHGRGDRFDGGRYVSADFPACSDPLAKSYNLFDLI